MTKYTKVEIQFNPSTDFAPYKVHNLCWWIVFFSQAVFRKHEIISKIILQK